MADVDRQNDYLKAVMDNKVVAVGEKGTGKVHVGGLSPNTDYTAGKIKVAFDKDGESALSAKASDLVDDPAFKTKPISVTGVSLDKTEASVEEGANVQLAATVAPSNATNKTVTWKSEDETIATVDNTGKVTGVAAGTVNIIATTADGAKTAQCALTVTAKKV